MQFLKSIIPIIDRSKFLAEIGDSSQLRAFFELLRKNPNITDEEVSGKLYSGDNYEFAYKKLKQRLRDKLTDHAIKHGVSYKNLDNYALLYRKCLQKTFATKALNLSNARSASVYVAENLIRTTQENEFTDLTMQLARELFFYYSAIRFHSGKAKKYEQLMHDMQELYANEIAAMQYYCELNAALSSSRASQKEKNLTKAIRYSEKVEEYLKRPVISYELLFRSFLVIAMRYELSRNYEKLLVTCDRALIALRSRKVSRNVAFYLFDQRKILCHIHLKQYDLAQEIARPYFKQLTPGQLNWFVLKSYVMLSYIHGKKYDEAFEIMHEVRSNKSFDSLPTVVRQTLTIYEAHIYFLASTGRVKSKELNSLKFRLYKFLNEIPAFAKDKRGLNIAVLIVHVLFLLKDKKYSDIIDRIDALNQYCHRYLRRDDTYRSNCFIKMLLKIAKADFNKQRAIRYAEPLAKKLNSVPLFLSDQTVEVEIIPYEDLWDMVLSLLDS